MRCQVAQLWAAMISNAIYCHAQYFAYFEKYTPQQKPPKIAMKFQRDKEVGQTNSDDRKINHRECGVVRFLYLAEHLKRVSENNLTRRSYRASNKL